MLLWSARRGEVVVGEEKLCEGHKEYGRFLKRKKKEKKTTTTKSTYICKGSKKMISSANGNT